MTRIDAEVTQRQEEGPARDARSIASTWAQDSVRVGPGP
jgi:hypothetical protein